MLSDTDVPKQVVSDPTNTSDEVLANRYDERLVSTGIDGWPFETHLNRGYTL